MLWCCEFCCMIRVGPCDCPGSVAMDKKIEDAWQAKLDQAGSCPYCGDPTMGHECPDLLRDWHNQREEEARNLQQQIEDWKDSQLYY